MAEDTHDQEWQEIHRTSLVADLHTHPAFKAWLLNRGKVRRLNRRLHDPEMEVEPPQSALGTYPFSFRTAFPLLSRGGMDVALATAYVPEWQVLEEIPLARLISRTLKTLQFNDLAFTKTYFEIAEDQFRRFDEAIDEYHAFLAKRRQYDAQTPRGIEVVTSVERLRSLIDMDAADRPMGMIRAVEGAHSLQGRLAGKSINFDEEASSVVRGIDKVQGAIPSAARIQPESENENQIRDELLANLKTLFCEYSVASMTIAHFYPNYVANPVFRFPEAILHFPTARRQQILDNYDPSPGLNKPYGREVIEWMLENGMLIDLTHCTPACRAEVYQMAKEKGVTSRVFVSHVGAYALNPTLYNLEDWEIKWMADNGGVIGVIFMNYWLMPYETELGIKYISQTIEHFYKVGGSDVVAIGSDFDGFTDPPDDIIDASMLPRLTQRLWSEFRSEVDRKYTPDEIHRFLGRNAIDFILRGWGKTEDTKVCADA